MTAAVRYVVVPLELLEKADRAIDLAEVRLRKAVEKRQELLLRALRPPPAPLPPPAPPPCSWAQHYEPRVRRSFAPRWTDCGDPECPQCGPVLAARLEREHRAMGVNTLRPGQGQESKRSRATGRETIRVVLRLTDEERRAVLAQLDAHPVRHAYLSRDSACRRCPPGKCRCEWISEVLLEVENPSALVAKRSAKRDITERVKQAIDRAQANMRGSKSAVVFISSESRRTPSRGSGYDR